MEGHSWDEGNVTNEQSPLINSTETNQHSPLLDHSEGSQDRISHGQSETGNDPAKGFSCRRCMIIPMCACYFFAAGIYMYEVPQYTQKVMKGHDEKEVPHNIRPRYQMLFKSQEQSEYNACAAVNKSDPAYKKFSQVQQDTALWLIYFNVASLLPAMFANLVWASYSDVIGRKFSILVCLVGFFIRMTVFTVVVYYKSSLVFIVIGNIFDGLTGSFTSFFAVLFSYVSDITYTGKQRTIAIVVVELVIGLTITFSSLFSGSLIQQIGYFYSGVGISCLTLLSIIILVALVPETLQNNNSQRHRNSVIKSIAESLRFYFTDGTKVKRAKYILLLLGFFFMGIPSLNRMTLEVLYQLGRPFCWSSTKIGWFGAIKIGISSLFGIVGAYVFKRCMADDTIAFLSLAASAAALVVEGLAKTDFVLYTVAVISASSGLPFPMIRSLMSCLTPADKQGAVFASIGFVETLCTLIGSVSTNAIYSATLAIMAGLVFLLMAVFTLIGAFFILAFMYVQRKYKEPADATTIIIVPSANTVDE